MNKHAQRPPFRRRHFLINRDFQLRYIGLVVGLASAMFLLCVLSAKHYINLNLDPLVESGMITSPALTALVAVEKEFLSKNLLAIFLIVITVLSVGGIFITHRVVGPLFALNRRMKLVTQEGFQKQSLKIRRTDEFQDLIETYNSMMVSLEKRASRENNRKEKKKAA